MKHLSDFIIENAPGFLVTKKGAEADAEKTCKPHNKLELIDEIKKRIKERGRNCSLNDIDVSEIEDFSWLFGLHSTDKFNGDISEWDVSHGKDFSDMFHDSDFTGDISGWDVSNAENMSGMFCRSAFRGDLSKWKVPEKAMRKDMFEGWPLNLIPAWFLRLKNK